MDRIKGIHLCFLIAGTQFGWSIGECSKRTELGDCLYTAVWLYCGSFVFIWTCNHPQNIFFRYVQEAKYYCFGFHLRFNCLIVSKTWQ